VVTAKIIHRVQPLVIENPRPNNDEDSEDSPTPVGARRDGLRQAATALLATNASRGFVVPNQMGDSESNRANEEEHEPEIHAAHADAAADTEPASSKLRSLALQILMLSSRDSTHLRCDASHILFGRSS